MSKNYNTTLQTNNSSLEDIITQLNNLPDSPMSATQATPTITVDSSTGLITATATQTAGYVTAGTKSATKQLAFQAAQTITPTTINQTIPANTYLGGVQTIKGDANLVASNIVSGKSIFGVVGTATTGGGGGDTDVEDGLVTRTITSYTNDRVASVGDYAFYYCTSLTSVSFPLCKSIGSSAFHSCKKLTTISFPQCTTIYTNVFRGCTSLTTISFPQCITIGNNAFVYCSSLTTISFPQCTSIGNYAFAYCARLTTASFPQCMSIGGNAFTSCSSLTTISFPQCTSIGNSAFASCASLTTISFPQCTIIGSNAFLFCASLNKLYLTGSSLCSLANSNAFSGAGITSTAGSIFVPASLVASYKAATNWAYFSNRIFAYN